MNTDIQLTKEQFTHSCPNKLLQVIDEILLVCNKLPEISELDIRSRIEQTIINYNSRLALKHASNLRRVLVKVVWNKERKSIYTSIQLGVLGTLVREDTNQVLLRIKYVKKNK